MGKSGRTIRWLVALALIAVAVLWPLVLRAGADEGGATADPVTITDYRADYHVSRDGNLLATETITAEFPGGRHGIFRYWDVADPDNSHGRPADSPGLSDPGAGHPGHPGPALVPVTTALLHSYRCRTTAIRQTHLSRR
jgi:hypothetical protein